jgi:hypothetical protein
MKKLILRKKKKPTPPSKYKWITKIAKTGRKV